MPIESTPGAAAAAATEADRRTNHRHGSGSGTLRSAECMSGITASSYCNGNGNVNMSILDDSSTSNYGDGEESSVVSSMMVPPQRWPGLGPVGPGAGLRHKDVSFSECSSTFSSSTLDRDMEIMDQLERSLSGSSQPTELSMCSSLQDPSLEQEQEHRLERRDRELDEEEVVPPDFYDNYTPGGAQNLPPAVAQAVVIDAQAVAPAPPPAYQYQYSRNRPSRKSSTGSHHPHAGGVMSSRGSKRDSFNSLNGTDLIAGAFCELDPTQPLNKMAVIEGRMRRSSPRNASFSSGSGSGSGRSSMKSSSRDYGHGSSSHSAHPELDFRENIFAEL
ncbi:GL27034 [Drosophila persimilis]|uniref:GL27034 n=1 Tax=Drosophila persimilis TaxID=7234 RepID=B4H7I7_DROPE|nr:GL27034 [Drosophila persimilis]